VALDDRRPPPAGAHELDERVVERLAHVLGVVLLEEVARRRPQLERDQRVALGLDPAQHLADLAAPDAVRLDQHQRALRTRAHLLPPDVGTGDPPAAATP
jgi:uncharacterized protein (DUF2236 family)